MYKKALKSLTDMREKLIEVFKMGENCRETHDEAMALDQKIKSPQFPKFKRQPENKYQTAYNGYLAKAEKRSENKRPAKIISTVVAIIAIAVLGHFFVTNFLDTAVGKKLESIDISATLVLLGVITVFFMVILVWRCITEVDLDILIYGLFSHVILTVFLGLLLVGMLIKAIPALYKTVGFIPPAVLIAIFAASFALSGLINLVNRLRFKHFKPSASQNKVLQELKAEDEKVKAENDQAEKAYYDKLNKEHEAEVPKLLEELESCMKRFEHYSSVYERLSAELDEMDALSAKDKNINMIDSLICIIQDRRADTVKEALQQYDIMVTNKQLIDLEQKRLKLQQEDSKRQEREAIRQSLARDDALALQRQQLRAYEDIRNKLDFASYQLYLHNNK